MEVARAKSRSLAISAAYRLVAIGRRIFGDQFMLNLCLDSAWLFRQFAYQMSYKVIGPAFLNETHAISDDLLKKWISPEATVIDIGCGYGRLCRLAAPYAKVVVGLDFDAHRIDLARRSTSQSNVEYRLADATTGFGKETYDIAILSHALEHIDDVDDLLRSVANIAGVLILEVPDFESDCLNLVRRDRGARWYTDNDHVREYTQGILCAELERNGWRISHTGRRGGMVVVVAKNAASERQA